MDDSSHFTGAAGNPNQVETEVTEYLSAPCSPHDTKILEYWKSQSQYPTLSKLAQQYLAVSASSAPVERLFSIGGKIFRPDLAG